MTPAEPQSASDYDDRTTAAVKAVLIEVGQILGAFKGKFAVVGGAVPWLRATQRTAIPALLAMKGHAINGRYKQKDSYDIYYCIRNYPDGIERLAEACRPLLEHASAARGFDFISEKFDRPDGYGPTCVRRFIEDTRILGARPADQWQQDAFGQVDAWARALGLKN